MDGPTLVCDWIVVDMAGHCAYLKDRLRGQTVGREDNRAENNQIVID